MFDKPWQVLQGDISKVIKTLPENYFDGVLSDPPYGLSFMGKAWDYSVPSAMIWRQVERSMKPGAHAMIFGGSRTFHRLMCNVEDGGLEPRDVLMWLYGSGFPKSYNIAKAIPRSIIESAEGDVLREFRGGVLAITKWVRDTARSKGVTNKQIDEHFDRRGMAGHWTTQASQPQLMSAKEWSELQRWLEVEPTREVADMYAMLRTKIRERVEGNGETKKFLSTLQRKPGAPEREPEPEDPTWAGHGTALKPAYEPILLARKMTEGNIAQNCLMWGTGSLDIASTRVGYIDEADKAKAAQGALAWKEANVGREVFGKFNNDHDLEKGFLATQDLGRWPSNVIIDDDVAVLIDVRHAGVSRFFYTPKADKGEKESGLDDFETFTIGSMQGGGTGANDPVSERFTKEARNIHPTIKPIDLDRYLAKMILPPPRRDGQPRRILVPYSGSGTEIIGALQAGWEVVVGIELQKKYVDITEARIKKGGVFTTLDKDRSRKKKRAA